MAYFHTFLNSVGGVATIESLSRGFCLVISSFVHSQRGSAACSDRVSPCARSQRRATATCAAVPGEAALRCRDGSGWAGSLCRGQSPPWGVSFGLSRLGRGVVDVRKGRGAGTIGLVICVIKTE